MILQLQPSLPPTRSECGWLVGIDLNNLESLNALTINALCVYVALPIESIMLTQGIRYHLAHIGFMFLVHNKPLQSCDFS